MDKDVTAYWKEQLRQWNCSTELLVMLHIPKSGGTSFRESLRNSFTSKEWKECNLEQPERRKIMISNERKEECFKNDQSTCASHFDWGTITGKFTFVFYLVPT